MPQPWSRPRPVGAQNSVALCDLRVFVEDATEAVTAGNPDVSARARVGKRLQGRCLAKGVVKVWWCCSAPGSRSARAEGAAG